ncbi:MAG: hypothetical protein LBL61_03015 [Elusimicrobiota bacterium]|jgi:hypothetical protein|nr:hypothetical protein [Elusimicrobiota bacterium]
MSAFAFFMHRTRTAHAREYAPKIKKTLLKDGLLYYSADFPDTAKLLSDTKTLFKQDNVSFSEAEEYRAYRFGVKNKDDALMCKISFAAMWKEKRVFTPAKGMLLFDELLNKSVEELSADIINGNYTPEEIEKIQQEKIKAVNFEDFYDGEDPGFSAITLEFVRGYLGDFDIRTFHTNIFRDDFEIGPLEIYTAYPAGEAAAALQLPPCAVGRRTLSIKNRPMERWAASVYPNGAVYFGMRIRQPWGKPLTLKAADMYRFVDDFFEINKDKLVLISSSGLGTSGGMLKQR